MSQRVGLISTLGNIFSPFSRVHGHIIVELIQNYSLPGSHDTGDIFTAWAQTSRSQRTLHFSGITCLVFCSFFLNFLCSLHCILLFVCLSCVVLFGATTTRLN